jgi:hypothetical protein
VRCRLEGAQRRNHSRVPGVSKKIGLAAIKILLSKSRPVGTVPGHAQSGLR